MSPTITCFAGSTGSSTFRRFERVWSRTIARRVAPSIDPELMIRMLIVGYSFGIRSDRRLCDEAPLNLAYRWFLQAGIGCQLRWFRLARWEALGRVQASLRAQRPAASADR